MQASRIIISIFGVIALGMVAFLLSPYSKSTVPKVPSPWNGHPFYEYNAQHKLIEVILPDKTAYQYRYDSNGNKVSKIDPTGQTWVYAHDQQGHILGITDPQGHVVRQNVNPGRP